MRRLALIAVAVASLALPLAARPRAVRHPSPARVMWIGAHPDDEILLAPVLGKVCVDGNVACALLVFTRGENGACVLPGGCGDLGALRAAEMQRAATALHAHLTQWTFSDVSENVDLVWSSEAFEHDGLLLRLATAIAAERPDVIYTFDPAHGSSCHAAHREVGALVLEALGRGLLPAGADLPRVVFVETAVSGLTLHPATPQATEVDGDWSYLVELAQIHASQFTAADVQALTTPQGAWIMPAGTAATYDIECPTLRRRTADGERSRGGLCQVTLPAVPAG